MNKRLSNQEKWSLALLKLEIADIPYVACHELNGHINLKLDRKTPMSFWAYSGTIYCKEFPTKELGIDKLIEHYNNHFVSN